MRSGDLRSPLLFSSIDVSDCAAIIPLLIRLAPVVELVDAVDSKSTIGNDVGVQVPPGAPLIIRHRPQNIKNTQ